MFTAPLFCDRSALFPAERRFPAPVPGQPRTTQPDTTYKRQAQKFVTVKDVQRCFSVDRMLTPVGSTPGWYAAATVQRRLVCVFGRPAGFNPAGQFRRKGGLEEDQGPIPATVMVGMGMQYYLWAMAHSGTRTPACTGPVPEHS